MARKKQTEIPGTEAPDAERVPVIEDTAEDLRELKAKRRKLADEIDTKKRTLVSAMNERGLTEYRYRDQDGVGRKVEINPETKIKISKVRKVPTDGAGDGGQDGEAAPAGPN